MTTLYIPSSIIHIGYLTSYGLENRVAGDVALRNHTMLCVYREFPVEPFFHVSLEIWRMLHG
jgi:hypothetical protein